MSGKIIILINIHTLYVYYFKYFLAENTKVTQQKMIRDKLAKWKEEKELKKKLSAQEKAKNKPFKVSHIDYKELEKLDAKIKATKPAGPVRLFFMIFSNNTQFFLAIRPNLFEF